MPRTSIFEQGKGYNIVTDAWRWAQDPQKATMCTSGHCPFAEENFKGRDHRNETPKALEDRVKDALTKAAKKKGGTGKRMVAAYPIEFTTCLRYVLPMRNIPQRKGRLVYWCFKAEEDTKNDRICNNTSHDHLLMHNAWYWAPGGITYNTTPEAQEGHIAVTPTPEIDHEGEVEAKITTSSSSEEDVKPPLTRSASKRKVEKEAGPSGIVSIKKKQPEPSESSDSDADDPE